MGLLSQRTSQAPPTKTTHQHVQCCTRCQVGPIVWARDRRLRMTLRTVLHHKAMCALAVSHRWTDGGRLDRWSTAVLEGVSRVFPPPVLEGVSRSRVSSSSSHQVGKATVRNMAPTPPVAHETTSVPLRKAGPKQAPSWATTPPPYNSGND